MTAKLKAVKKATGGGRFDPTAETVYFTAGPSAWDFSGTHWWNLVAANDADDELLEKMINAGNRVLLDSGVFWLTNRHMRSHPGMTMDQALALPPDAIDGFDWLWDRYVALVKEYESDLWGYIELDQGGAENKRKTRAKLEAMGLAPMPVYHPLNDGWDYFDELCRGYDRICLGNIVQANKATRKHLLATLWERKRLYPDVWVHVLGLTPNEITTVYPSNSCDSSSWAYSIRFGAPSSPGARSMGASFDKFAASYSYELGTDKMGDTGYERGGQFLEAEGVFTLEIQRAQIRDMMRVFELDTLWPARDKREGVLR